MIEQLSPVSHVESMSLGYSRPQKVMLSDGRSYIVKFINNPSGTRILANEYVVGRLAEMLALPIVPFEIVGIPKSFIERYPALSSRRFQPGTAFASRYIEHCLSLDKSVLSTKLNIANREALAGIIVFDQWIGNTDRKVNNLLVKPLGRDRYHIYLIDHGHCFHKPNWTIGTLRRRPRVRLRERVHKWLFTLQGGREQELAQFMKKMMALPENRIREVIQSIPGDWNVSTQERAALLEYLLQGRKHMSRFYLYK